MSSPKTKKKIKKKLNKKKVIAVMITTIAVLMLTTLLAGVGIIASMLQDKPELDLNKLENQESSIIYDINGDVIAELGVTIRENVSYDRMPASLIDAFIAVEDSRFYEHNGFDLPRFARAILGNLKTLSFNQGGSTFTMQLIKNSFFVDDETGKGAARSGLDGVKRKVQEIALAMELENTISKDIIFELYINKINFGGNRNIRGVQKASEYFFGKDVSELNLSESALLAGVINAPTSYNPYNHIEAATSRRNAVLELMKRHGYISDNEFELAKSIKVEDLLVDPYASSKSGSGTKYQAYIDEVISEAYDLTGQDPYNTTMHIYTYMDPNIQTVIDNIQNENTDGYITFPDENLELASLCVNNKNGGIYGILGGRNYSGGGALLLNHATSQFKQPGSAIKPILDYALAFENLGWATSHVVIDKPITYPGTNAIIANATGKYYGQISLTDAVGNSLNTPAIQTLQEVINKTSNAYVVDYLQSLDFDVKLENFNVQYGIGGSDLAVSCKQMAGAQAALMNYGNYIKPHTIKKIEFNSEKQPLEPIYTPKSVLSEQAAFLTTELLYTNVTNGYSGFLSSLQDEYAVYAKTGTTDWGTAGQQYGIPTGSIKDAWLIGSSSDFTVATWMGYEKASSDKRSYITWDDYVKNIHGRTTNLILDETTKSYGLPSKLSKPDGITSIQHILAVYPYTSPIPGMDSAYITNGLISSKDAKLASPENIKIEKLSGANIGIDTDGDGTISIEWAPYPDESKLTVKDNVMDISLYGNNGEVLYSVTGTRLFDYSWVYGAVKYKAEIYVEGELIDTVVNDDEKYTKKYELNPNEEVLVLAYYGFENGDIKSNEIKKEATIIDPLITITFPDATVATRKDIDNWFKEYAKYDFKYEITEMVANNNNPDGTIRVLKLDSDSDYYTLGEKTQFKKSVLMENTFKILIYKDNKFTITANSKTFKAGQEVQLKVNPEQSGITWKVKGKATINVDGLLTIDKDAKKDDEISVAATSNSYSAELKIKITK